MSGIWTLQLLLYSAVGNAFITNSWAVPQPLCLGRRIVITEWKASRSFQKQHQRPWTQTSTIYLQSNTILLHLFLLLPSPLTEIIFEGLFIPNCTVATGDEIYFISSLTSGLKALCLSDCVCMKGEEHEYKWGGPWNVCINLWIWLPVNMLPLVGACVRVQVWEDNIMHLHAVLQCGRMSLIYNHDERSVHLIKQHIGILLHSIG